MQPTLRCPRRGQVFLEFALVLPLCLTMFTAMVDLGLFLHRYVSVQTAVREGARAAASGMGDEQIRSIVLTASEYAGLVAADVEVLRQDGDLKLASLDPGDGTAIPIGEHMSRYQSVEVRVLTYHRYLVPIFFPGEGWTRIFVTVKTVRPLP